MWVAKLRLRHEDCVIGSRCKKFNVTSIGVPFNTYTSGNFQYFSHFETLQGKDEDIKKFVEDLKKDSSIENLEVQGNSLFFLVKVPAEKTIPTTHYDPRIFFLKPVFVDNKGYEHWEIGSWKKEIINEFIMNLQKESYELKILKITDEKLTDIYFPQVMPFLTKQQKKALEIAVENDYYNYPRKAELKDLAKIAGISLSTFREHLRRAEKRIMPDLVRNVRDEE